jgi:hypothetical protein
MAHEFCALRETSEVELMAMELEIGFGAGAAVTEERAPRRRVKGRVTEKYMFFLFSANLFSRYDLGMNGWFGCPGEVKRLEGFIYWGGWQSAS